MPLGEGYTAEEQLTGDAEFGGLQLVVYPMKRDVYKELFEKPAKVDYDDYPDFVSDSLDSQPMFSRTQNEMGLAPGGLIKQEIKEDNYDVSVWDQDNGSRCFVHLVNSAQYKAITGSRPPHRPVTAKDYKNANLPWFNYYDDGKALSGSDKLGSLTSLAAMHIKKGKGQMENNKPVRVDQVKVIDKRRSVREGNF